MMHKETVAIAKVIKGAVLSAARNELEPGEYTIDMRFGLSGTIRVAEDTEKTPTVSIPIIEALALLCHDAGITGKHALRALQNAMTRAIENDENAQRIIASMRENMANAEQAVRATLAELPKTPVKGKVTTTLVIETLEPVAV